MAKLWTANKTWVSDSPNANTEYLVGVANGGCNYQSIPQGGTKRILVSNGANGNVAYGNRSVPLPEDVGDIQFPTQYVYKSFYFPLGGSSIQFDEPNYTISWNSTNKRFDINTNKKTYARPDSPLYIYVVSTNNPQDLLEAVKKVKRFILYKRDQDSGEFKAAQYLTITDTSQWKFSSASTGYRGVSLDTDYIQLTEGTTSVINPDLSEQPVYLIVPKSS